MDSLPLEPPRPSRESAFRRELRIATLLFTLAFLATLGVGGYILVRDLGEKEIFRLLQDYSSELETSLAKIPQTETRKGFQQEKLVTTRLNEFMVDKKLFDSFELYDEQGELVQKGDVFRQGVVGVAPNGEGLRPGQGKIQLGQRIPVEVQVPIEPGKMGRAVLTVSQEVLARRAADFRDELATKTLALVAMVLVLLAGAYLYVVRLMRLSRRLEADAQAQERLSYLGLLSSGMAHEIKNPLNSIQMNLQLLEEELSGHPETAEASGYLHPVRKEVKRLERLVNDFLLYARPLQPTLAPVNVGGLLGELKALVDEEARQRGVEIAVEALSDLPEVSADDGLLRTALLNLLFNALHASPEGGRVTLSAALREGRVELSVRDSGAGVTAGQQDRIFQIFVTDKPGGTGLGLPIARRIAESHGGSLEIRKSDTPGALFVLTLPKGAAAP